MRMDKARAAGCLLIADMVAGLLGCGNVSNPGNGVPIDTAPQQIAATVCPKAYSCCTAQQLMGNDMAGTDEVSCERKTADAFQNQLTAVQTSQSDGRVRYDGDKLAACLAYIRESSCETLGKTNHFAGIPGCDNFVMPLVSDGGGCAYDWECTGGLCTDGKCGTLPGPHEACTTNSRCAAGSSCAGTTNMCVAQVADGDSCTDGTECPSGVCTGGVCTARPTTCFYSSGCSVAGGGAAASLVSVAGLAALMALAVARRRARRARVST
jgi:hypothetical protein